LSGQIINFVSVLFF